MLFVSNFFQDVLIKKNLNKIQYKSNLIEKVIIKIKQSKLKTMRWLDPIETNQTHIKSMI